MISTGAIIFGIAIIATYILLTNNYAFRFTNWVFGNNVCRIIDDSGKPVLVGWILHLLIFLLILFIMINTNIFNI
jgi:hypothetical protein